MCVSSRHLAPLTAPQLISSTGTHQQDSRPAVIVIDHTETHHSKTATAQRLRSHLWQRLWTTGAEKRGEDVIRRGSRNAVRGSSSVMNYVLLSSQFWPMLSMSRGVINCVKQFFSHPLSRIKWVDQWAVDRDPVLTSTSPAKIGKTAIQCVLVLRESFTKWCGSRVFYSCPCGPRFVLIEPNQLSLITRTHCTRLTEAVKA